MIRYFRKHIALSSAALLLGILTQLLTPLSAVMEQRMIDLVVSGNISGYLSYLWVAGIVVLGIAAGYFLDGIAEKWFTAEFWESLRNDLYDGIMKMSVTRFAQKDTAVYMSYMNTVGTVVQNLTRPIFYLVSYGVSAIAVLGIMIWYSPLLAVLSVLCGGLSMILPFLFNKKFAKLMTEGVEFNAAMSVELKESLGGHDVIASYEAFPNLRRRFIKASSDVAHLDKKTGVAIAELENIGRFMDRLSWFVTFLAAGTMAVRGDITVGTLVLFVSLFGFFSNCLTIYAQMLPLLLGNRKNIKLLLDIIDDNSKEFTGVEPAHLENALEVSGLSFRYKDDVPVIENLNMTIHKNEKVALIGQSGCGKSTLIKLLTGSYADYQGTVRYDGVELHDIAPDMLRELVTVIHQNTFIFNDTLRFNICLGEDFTDEALAHAVKLSGVERFLGNIPGGLDGECGENGSKLSGGERQRIALARALIRDVNVLFLDEGVSAIDVTTANEIEQELLDIKDLTLLTVTHRIKDGLTQQYDRIITMNDGTVKEAGVVQI